MQKGFEYRHSEMYRQGYLDGKFDAYISLINKLSSVVSKLGVDANNVLKLLNETINEGKLN